MKMRWLVWPSIAVAVWLALVMLSRMNTGPSSGEQQTLTQPTAPFDARAYLPLTIGTKWRYQVTTHGKWASVYEMVMEVTEQRDCDGAPCFMITSEREGPNPRPMLYAYRDDGVVSFAGLFHAQAEEFETPFLALPSPLSAGATWKWEGPSALGPKKILTSEFAGIGKCAVPAGTFDCIKIKLLDDYSGIKSTYEYWFAKDVGLVKLTGATGQFGFKGALDAHELLAYEIVDR